MCERERERESHHESSNVWKHLEQGEETRQSRIPVSLGKEDLPVPRSSNKGLEVLEHQITMALDEGLEILGMVELEEDLQERNEYRWVEREGKGREIWWR